MKFALAESQLLDVGSTDNLVAARVKKNLSAPYSISFQIFLSFGFQYDGLVVYVYAEVVMAAYFYQAVTGKNSRLAHHSVMSSSDASKPQGRASFRIPSATKEGRFYSVLEPNHDIDGTIQFSRVRFVFTLIGLLLVCSDVARAGLGFRRLDNVMDPYTPETGIYFGPYGYPVAQIIKTKASNGSYEFSPGDSGIKSTRVWSYKYDSVSIALRALVNAFGSQPAWPPCLLYLDSCTSDHLSLQTTFGMMDSLVSAIRSQWFIGPKD